jgi:hypothetical protein
MTHLELGPPRGDELFELRFVKKAEPACETFVGVIVERIMPKVAF